MGFGCDVIYPHTAIDVLVLLAHIILDRDGRVFLLLLAGATFFDALNHKIGVTL